MAAGQKRLVNYGLYTVGDVASGIAAVTPGILLMFYMTNILGVPVELAALAGFLPKILDFLCTPLIGALSDRTRSRFGRRRPYMLIASLTIFPTFGLMWMAPFQDPALSAYFVLVLFCASTILFSCFVVPFFALNAEIAIDYEDRTALNSYRSFYSLLGAMFAGAGAPLIVEFAGGGRHGYAMLGLVMSAIMTLATLITFFAAREPEKPAAAVNASLRDIGTAIISNRPFALLFACYFIHIVSISLFGTTLAYFSTYVLERGTGFLSLLFFIKYGVSTATIPLWVMIARRIGKFRSFALCLGLATIALAAFSLLGRATPMPFLLLTVILYGLVGGGVQVFVFSMLADCIHHGGQSGATASEATLSGIFIAGEKLAFGFGTLLSGLILGAAGLVATTKGAVVQTPQVLDGIRAAASWGPAALNILALLLFLFYRDFERRVVALHVRPAATSI